MGEGLGSMDWRLRRPAAPVLGAPELLGAIGLGLLLTARFVPLARWLPFWGCSFRRVTGYPCVSCGMTRSFDWFMQGRFADAFAVNPLGFGLATAAGVAALWLLLAPLRPPRLELRLSPRWRRRAWLLAGTVAALNWGWVLWRTPA